MKRTTFYITAIAIILLFSLTASGVFAQTAPKQTDKVLKDTTIAGKSYKLYIGSRGGKYTIRTSKTGNIYKAYINK